MERSRLTSFVTCGSMYRPPDGKRPVFCPRTRYNVPHRIVRISPATAAIQTPENPTQNIPASVSGTISTNPCKTVITVESPGCRIVW